MTIQLCCHHIHLAFAGPHLYEANTKERNRFPSVEKLQEIDGKLGYYNLAPIVSKTFKIMGISSYSEIYESKDEALTGIIS